MRVPLCMIVNSSFGPLNCSEYDSGLVSTDLNAPAAGIDVGLIHASAVRVVAGEMGVDDGIDTL